MKHVRQLREIPRVQDIRLETDAGVDGPTFQLVNIANWDMQVIYWRRVTVAYPGNSEITAIIEQTPFNAGARYHEEDVFWQSETLLSTYDAMQHPDDGVTSSNGRVDISRNPARRTLFPGMWLQAAWQMWFGAGAFRYIPRSRVLSFPNATVIAPLARDGAYVMLYEDGYAFDRPENRERLSAFRRWTSMDELELQASERGAERIDPTVEFEEGTFEHGGVRRQTVWLNEGGDPVRKSLGTRTVVIEFDEDGRQVWSSESM